MTVLRYSAGADVASRYATKLAEANSCTGVRVLEARARPDVGTYRLDADWAARQQGLTANVSRIVTETSSASSDSISSPCWNEVAVDAQPGVDFRRLVRLP